VARVVLYTAVGCHLCDRARRTLEHLREEVDFELHEIDITGDAELEARYRELIPVGEIDGERVFAYFVPAVALRRRLRRA
jgi:glutaredoxin